MQKNIYYTVDYMCNPVYSGELFKDAVICFRRYFDKYSYMIDADYCYYYNDNLNQIAFTRIGYPQPIAARLVISKRIGDQYTNFTNNQKGQIAANINTMCREYGLMLRSDILERMKV